MRRVLCALCFVLCALVASAEVQVIGGRKYECRDGVCYLVEDDATTNFVDKGIAISESGKSGETGRIRIAQGYMPAAEFVAFLEGNEVDSLAGHGLWVMLLLVFLGGLAMNLTPCVLPMVPINLMIIGRSAKRGLAYGLGIALAYGLLGVGSAVGGLAFGDIQGSPWFNAAVAVVFAGLALALFDVWFLDLSKKRGAYAPRAGQGLGFSFFMGAMSAVLAGACVAPVLISVLLLTTDLVAKGNRFAVLLPFVMGVGMALPWPFAGAGMKVLPKPGAWMKWVNRVFGVVVLGFAAWYGQLAWRGWSGSTETAGTAETSGTLNATPATFNSQLLTLNSESAKPILVDCWATWCKNCAAMDKVMEEEDVREALKPFTVIKLQAEDISELRKVKGFESIRGLPAFVIFE